MKLRGANLNARRLRRRRLALSLAVFVISVAGLALMAQSGAPAAPFFVIALSIVSVVAGIRAIDSVLSRSWESLASTYQ